ncbi:uncharacterized protein [Palaemon carinicauda]|uniref:uncharacterized protein n=1 Tax=Palaemon carinicauda TaxID=392227 RepID=UPI0035B691C9
MMATCWHWHCVLLVIIVFLSLNFIAYYLDSLFLNGTRLPRPFQNTPEEIQRFCNKSPHINKYLDKNCYHYDDLKARFIGDDPYFNFTKEHIFDCARKLWNTKRNPKEVDPWQNKTSYAKASASVVRKHPTIHIMIAGDSHMRHIFEVFVKRILDPRVKYRIARFKKDHWEDVYAMGPKKRDYYHEDYQEVIHLGVPLRITYVWDKLLKGLPSSLKSWIAGEKPRPTFLLFATALHYIMESRRLYQRFGPKRASERYANQLRVLAPLVKEFAKTTPTIFKFMDHLQIGPENFLTNKDHIDLYNDIARKTLVGHHLVLWDSTVPLSDLYNEECQKYERNTPETEMWNCQDKMHMGHIVIQQYLNMYLNAICNTVDE